MWLPIPADAAGPARCAAEPSLLTRRLRHFDQNRPFTGPRRCGCCWSGWSAARDSRLWAGAGERSLLQATRVAWASLARCSNATAPERPSSAARSRERRCGGGRDITVDFREKSFFKLDPALDPVDDGPPPPPPPPPPASACTPVLHFTAPHPAKARSAPSALRRPHSAPPALSPLPWRLP
jgi:hypothetical protein